MIERTAQEYHDWLDGLKAGDTVVLVRSGWYYPLYEFLEVKRTTPTRIYTSDVTWYHRKTGRQAGAPYNPQIKPDDAATREGMEYANRMQKKHTILNKLSKFSWSRLKDETLQRVYDLVVEEVGEDL